MKFTFLIPVVVFAVAFLFIASVAFGSFKKNKNNTSKPNSKVQQNPIVHTYKTPVDNVAKPVERVCDYCGSTITAGANKCDSCGAKVKKMPK